MMNKKEQERYEWALACAEKYQQKFTKLRDARSAICGYLRVYMNDRRISEAEKNLCLTVLENLENVEQI